MSFNVGRCLLYLFIFELFIFVLLIGGYFVYEGSHPYYIIEDACNVSFSDNYVFNSSGFFDKETLNISKP